MKANEFRIGNYIKKQPNVRTLSIEDKLGVIIVRSISDGIINQWRDMGAIGGITNPEPIPLTEEWLIKFGFEKEEEGEDMILDINHALDICYDHNKIGLRDYIETSPFGKGNMVISTSYVDCEHVHQLQNLVFALTGEELTIQDD